MGSRSPRGAFKNECRCDRSQRRDPNNTGDGLRIEVEGRLFSGPDRHRLLSTFLKTLAQTAPELPVILDIEPEVPLGEALATYDAARAADFQAIHFAIAAPATSNTVPAAAR